MKILRIKTENILTLAYIPVAIINLTKANSEMLLLAIMMQLLLLSGLFYGIRTTRHELIADIKNGDNDDLIEEIETYLDAVRNFFKNAYKVYEGIKKEVTQKQPKTTKLKDAFLKYNF